MLTESATVMSVEVDCLWVETQQASTCGSCSARKGCGQSLLAKWGGRSGYIRALLPESAVGNYRVGERVVIAVPEDVVVLGSVFVYLLPLLLMLAAVLLGHAWFESEIAVIAAALLGLLLGGGLVRCHAYLHRHDKRLQPVVVNTLVAAA